MQHKSDNDHFAILLLAFGGPTSLSEVEPFLRNVFSGRPFPPSLIEHVRERYQAIGGASPLLHITRKQARALKECLRRIGKDLEVSVGMRYWHPSISEVLTALEQDGVKKVLYLIMSPYCTPATTGEYDHIVRQWQESSSGNIVAIPVSGWHTDPHYIDALVETIHQGREAFPPNRRNQVPVIFTAHSLPQDQVKHDPYVDQLQASVGAVAQRLGIENYYLAFQSQGQGDNVWLQPYPGQVLEELAHSGIRDALISPVGFVADHLETLYDLDIALKHKADMLGVQLERSPALNDSPRFIKALADTILSFLVRSSL